MTKLYTIFKAGTNESLSELIEAASLAQALSRYRYQSSNDIKALEAREVRVCPECQTQDNPQLSRCPNCDHEFV